MYIFYFQAFLVFDKDRNGLIDIDELKSVLISLGENLSDEELREMMKEADIDGNGGVDFDGKQMPLYTVFL